MNRYESSTPRAALGLTAVAMAAITMATLIVLPAEFDSVDAQLYPVTTARPVASVPIEVAVSPARSDESEAVAHEERVQADRTDLGAQALHANRHRSASRSRADG